MEHSNRDGYRFAIIGAGMAGILSAVKLHEAGYRGVTIYEKADRLGGTWRENRYPGIACDVPSLLYSYSFAPNPAWSHVFSPGAEICTYLETVARRFGVEEIIQYGEEVIRLDYRDCRWDLETARGRHDRVDFVIAATGVLHHPAYPDIAGLDSFTGACFHSARWDESVSIDGKRIGIVGTGSTAVQIVGAIVDRVKSLHLFQRTAQWVLAVPNPPIGDDDRRRYGEDPDAMMSVRDELARSFEVNFANAVVDAGSPQMEVLEQLCRANLEDNVADPVLREQLRPDYRAACKRLVISPDFYGAIQRPNARLVTERIDRVEASGVRTADGGLHEVDVLVLATGFQVDRFLRPITVTGRNGIALDDVWAARPSAYLAISVPDFPNLFMLNGPNGPVGNFSLIDVAELQFDYILQLIEIVTSGAAAGVAASHAAAERFEEERVEAAKNTVWVTGCRSWYLDDRGVPAAWPWSFTRFRERMAAPDLDDYDVFDGDEAGSVASLTSVKRRRR